MDIIQLSLRPFQSNRSLDLGRLSLPFSLFTLTRLINVRIIRRSVRQTLLLPGHGTSTTAFLARTRLFMLVLQSIMKHKSKTYRINIRRWLPQ